jgi:hypothetical protein
MSGANEVDGTIADCCFSRLRATTQGRPYDRCAVVSEHRLGRDSSCRTFYCFLAATANSPASASNCEPATSA